MKQNDESNDMCIKNQRWIADGDGRSMSAAYFSLDSSAKIDNEH